MNCLKDPILAVRCITFNHENYIRDTLEGFVKQKTDYSFVAIVHDDASTDNTTEIVREYERKYPDIIKPIYETENLWSKHDGSLSRAIRQAIPESVKYIALCEGDDYWTDPNKLQKQIEFLESHPEFTMCFHNANIKRECGVTEDFTGYFVEDREYDATELFSGWTVPTASIVMRKEILDIPRQSPDFVYGDIVVIENCAHLGRVWGFSDYMSVYRMQATGVLWNGNLAAQERRLRKVPKHMIALKKFFPKISRKIANKRICNSYITLFLHYGTFWEKFRWGMLAFYYSPLRTVRKVLSLNGFLHSIYDKIKAR